MKKRVLSIFFALVLAFSLLPTGTFAESAVSAQSFEDVESSAWYYSAVKYTAQNGLMSGVSDKSFAPEAAITRAVLVEALYRLDGSNKTDKTVKFTDVDASAGYFDAAAWAGANKIANGSGDGRFAPEDNVTREQMAAMLQRFAKYKGRNTDGAADISAYTDASRVSDWASLAMGWAVFGGLINGTESSTLSPADSATRAQAAAVLMRYVSGATLEKRSVVYVSQFIKGNFGDFYKDCNETLQKGVTQDSLLKTWSSLTQAMGGVGETVLGVYTRQNGNDIVVSTVEGPLFGIKVTIIYDADGKPSGIWTAIMPKNPPEPKSSDTWEEVSVSVGEMKLPGILTLPKNVEKPAVVILVQGSGSSDMNEALGKAPNRPFEDIARGLAEQGVATLRYNKRTYQYPYGTFATIQDEVLDDAASAVKLLSTDGRVDAERIYLLGHSLGGMMAPKITADNLKIKGFISMAGTLRPIQDIMLDQNAAAITAAASLTEEQKKAMLAQAEAEIEKTKTLTDGGTGYIMGVPASYWKSINAIDGKSIVKGLNVPMLILQGNSDFQVYTDKDYKLWQTTLAGRSNVTFKLYDGLSHLFMTNQISSNGAPDITLYDAPNHVAPQVIGDIASWVKMQ